MMKQVRVGVEIWPLVKINGGVGFYIFFLLDELIRQNPQWEFYLYTPCTSETVDHFRRYPNVVLRVIPLFSFKYTIWRKTIIPRYMIWRNIAVPYFLRKDKIDVLWENVMLVPFLKPRKMKSILTIYDFVAYLFPKTASFPTVFFQRCFTPSSLRSADYIISISQGTAEKLKAMFGADSHAVVIPPVKPDIFYRESSQLLPFLAQQGLEYNDYLISVSTWEPRKNFTLLINLYCKALEKYGLERVMPMVIVGGGGWKNKEIKETFYAAQERYPSHFKLAGSINDHELSFFLSGARYYIALSVYEGYGMPLAEARRCRTPVICLDSPEMREAAEEDAIFLTRENVETDLLELMLRNEGNKKEKPELKLQYPSTAEGASKIADLIRKC